MPLPTAETLTPLLDDYLSMKITPNHEERIEDAAYQLATNGTPAFKEGFELQVTGVPVGVHHGWFIERSLSCLAMQAEQAPSTPAIVLSLNHPKYNWQAQEQLARNVDIVQRFQDEHPRLPLSYFTTGYEDGVPIGDIRDGAFGAAAIFHKDRARIAGIALKDLIFTNWDIDTLDATPDYFAQTQRSYVQHGEPVWTAHPNTQHARIDPEQFPDANRLIAWYDLGVRAGKASLPAHYSTNLHSWLLGRGYMGGSYGEHAGFQRRLRPHVPDSGAVPVDHLATEIVKASPHRFMENMAARQPLGYGELKVADKLPDAKSLSADVSPSYFDAQLKRLVPQVGSPIYLRRRTALLEAGMSPSSAADGALEYMRTYLHAAAAVIGSVHDTEGQIAAYAK